MMKNEIRNALMKDVDMSAEEYRAKCERADDITSAHGEKHDAPGKVPVSERTRHDRIEMNFYGSCLNILMGIYSAVCELNATMAALISEPENEGDTKHDSGAKPENVD